MPLTLVEIGMIQHCLEERIRRLNYYYTKVKPVDNCGVEVHKIIKTACEAIEAPVFEFSKSSDKMAFSPKTIQVIEYELYGIIHSTFKVLDTLGIVSNPRNTREKPITSDTIGLFAEDIHNESLKTLKEIVTRNLSFAALEWDFLSANSLPNPSLV